jgi:integrase/recombinase XerD
MLNLYRRHKPTCRYFAEPRTYNKCKCKIWAAGMLAGAVVRKSVGTRDWTKANQIIQGWEAEEHVTVKYAAVTLDDAWKSIHVDFASRNLAHETIRKYKQLEKQMKAFAKDRGLTLLSQFDLDSLGQFRATWKDKPRSAGKKIERLRSLFGFAVDREWVKSNIPAKMKMPIVHDIPTMPLTPVEMQKIYQACDTLVRESTKHEKMNLLRLKPLILVMRYTGLRLSDASCLTTAQIDGNTIVLRQAKTHVNVRVPIPEFVKLELAKCPKQTKTHYFRIELRTKDHTSGGWQDRIKEVFDLAGIDKGEGHATSHRLRDTFAVELLLSGVPIERVSKLLGHSSVAITEKHYAPWNKARQLQAEADVVRSWKNDPMLNGENLDVTKLPRTESVQFQN